MKTKIIGLFFLALSLFANAQNSTRNYVATVGFYNLENLFDTIDSVDEINCETLPCKHTSVPFRDSLELRKGRFDYNKIGRKTIHRNIYDESYTPNGRNGWNTKRYHKKLDQLSKVIKDIGFKTTLQPPTILGVCEVENRKVLEDLVNHPTLKPYEYEIVHHNSLDERGIDVALLYRKRFFTPSAFQIKRVKMFDEEGRRDYTRDVLVVSGKLVNEKMHFLVNHWPSRSGGEKRSAPLRLKAAENVKEAIDSLQKIDPNAKIMVMGDFNDDPTNASIQSLGTEAKIRTAIKNKAFYNPMESMLSRNLGTLAWRDSWNLFDQILVSSPTLDQNSEGFSFYKAGIYNASYLQQPSGRFKGYPFRTQAGASYLGGYSDHFPVYIYLKMEVK